MDFIPETDKDEYKIGTVIGFYISSLIFITILYFIWIKDYISYFYMPHFSLLILLIYLTYEKYSKVIKNAITF